MNPDNKPNLPPPVGALPPAASMEAAPLPQIPEQLMAPSPEAAGNRQTPGLPPVAVQDDSQQAIAPIDNALQAALGTPAPASTTTTDNTVTIDKEWIEKAKRVVAQTGDNPYEQNRQLAHVKAGYLQERYGKAIKLAE